MARAYAGRLGCIAMITAFLQSILAGNPMSVGILNALTLLMIFAPLGLAIGALTESVIRQSLEANFRQRIESYRMQAKDRSVKTR